MPLSFLDLVRYSLFQPRTAAKIVARLNLSRPVLVQAAMLLSVLTVIMQYFLMQVMVRFSDEPASVVFPLPIGDLVFQFAGAFLCAALVVMLAKGARIEVPFNASMAVFIWYNILMIFISGIVMLAYIFAGSMSIIAVMFAIVWAPVAMTMFWSELLQTKNLFLAFIVPVVAIVLASAISVIAASILGLPLMEIVIDV